MDRNFKRKLIVGLFAPALGLAVGTALAQGTPSGSTDKAPAMSERPAAAGSWNAQTFDLLDKNKDGQISREEAQADPALLSAWSKLDAEQSRQRQQGGIREIPYLAKRCGAEVEPVAPKARARHRGPFSFGRPARVRRLSTHLVPRVKYRIFMRYRPVAPERVRLPRASRLRRASLPVQLQLSPWGFASGGAGRARACARLRRDRDHRRMLGRRGRSGASCGEGDRAEAPDRERAHAARRAEAGVACYGP